MSIFLGGAFCADTKFVGKQLKNRCFIKTSKKDHTDQSPNRANQKQNGSPQTHRIPLRIRLLFVRRQGFSLQTFS